MKNKIAFGLNGTGFMLCILNAHKLITEGDNGSAVFAWAVSVILLMTAADAFKRIE